jgi:hypothetical protein
MTNVHYKIKVKAMAAALCKYKMPVGLICAVNGYNITAICKEIESLNKQMFVRKSNRLTKNNNHEIVYINGQFKIFVIE